MGGDGIMGIVGEEGDGEGKWGWVGGLMCGCEKELVYWVDFKGTAA